MKGQKTQRSQDGGIGNAKKRTKNQSQEQLIEELHRVIAEKDQLIAENSQALAEKDQLIAENAQAMAKNSQVITKKDQELAEKDQVIAQKDRLILRLRMTGAAFMEEAFLRFPHLPEQIMEELDFKSLMNARVVAISWKQFIDAREHRWYPFKNEIAELKKQCWGGKTPFHLACRNSQAELAEFIIKNSLKLNIEFS